MEAAGFRLAVDGPDLVVSPPGRLNEKQRRYIKTHKPEIIKALLGASVSGGDLPRRVSVHFTLRDGQGGGPLLGQPGRTEEELRDILHRIYGTRLESINGAEP